MQPSIFYVTLKLLSGHKGLKLIKTDNHFEKSYPKRRCLQLSNVLNYVFKQYDQNREMPCIGRRFFNAKYVFLTYKLKSS